MVKNVIFVATHPIQYFVPLYREIALNAEIDSEVLFCSDETVSGSLDRQFGVNVKWDIPLLDNYKYTFLKNNSFNPSIYNGFWGLINFDILSHLRKKEKSLIIVNGWNNVTFLMSIVFGKLFGHTIGLRCESPFIHEQSRPKFQLFLRKVIFKHGLFRLIDKFFFIGNENKRFYEFYGVNEDKLFYTPYSVDNDKFLSEYIKLSPSKNDLRKNLGICEEKMVVLFSGKYIQKKRPLDLLNAVKDFKNTFTIFMGDGELRSDMEVLINKYKLQDKVLLTGFINQNEISKFYTIADVFVMCSEEGETWGLSTNEAMNFNLPIILYDSVGCASDLLVNNKNGILVEKGNIGKLKEAIEFYSINTKSRIQAGLESGILIKKYSYEKIILGLKEALGSTKAIQ
jgi:glycosyltransferase involved in cell wall biosynthesis